MPPWVSDTLDRLADAVLDGHGPGSGMLGLAPRRGSERRQVSGGAVSAGRACGRGVMGTTRGDRDPLAADGPAAVVSSPGALELRDGMVTLEGVISG